MSSEWPNQGDLAALGREAQEHKRVWGIVAALVDRLKRSESNLQRLPTLEHRIEAQRKALARLEECRAFELQTEHLLVEGLRKFTDGSLYHTSKSEYASALLIQYEIRKGPRPENQGE